MRIWYQSYTDPDEHREYISRLGEFLRSAAAPGTTIDVKGMVPSAKHVHGLTEFRCAGHVIRNAIQAEREGYDAFIIGHFQDAGLNEAKSVVDIPVIGLGESSMLYACTLGRKIGLVTIDDVFIPWHEEQAVRYGLDKRVVGVRAINTSLDEFMRAFATEEGYRVVIERFRTQVAPLVAEGIDVILPAGGLPMLLLSRERGFVVDGAPVVNGIPIAVKMAEAAVALRRFNGLGVSRASNFAKPPAQALEEFLGSR
ncbi:MAG TPA: aspartate/glutamate racemase family protein [Alphaproteobacteria bacterium]